MEADKIIEACKAAAYLNMGTDGLQVPLASVMDIISRLEAAEFEIEGQVKRWQRMQTVHNELAERYYAVREEVRRLRKMVGVDGEK